jgi:acrylyl-CoA reductase (NADPH)
MKPLVRELAQGPDLPATVMPFILRDVTLAGVNSVLTPREKRAGDGPRFCKAQQHDLTTRLDDVPTLASEVLVGKTLGRVVIDL